MIAIIGGGSVGLLLASFFAEAGQEVAICTKTEKQARAITNHGLHFHSCDGTSKTYRVNAIPLDEYAVDTDYTIVCVKQHQLAAVQSHFHSNRHIANSTIVFTQNGMGHINQLNQLPEKNIILGVVEHGALKLNDREVRHTGKGSVKISAYRGELDLHFWSRMKPVSWEVKEDWAVMLHEKLVVNSVINPLTALFGVKNKEVLENEQLRELGWLLCQETCKILRIADTEKQWQNVLEVCRKTGENKSSMLKDIENSRETEIESIGGYLLSEAQRQGIGDAPYTYFMYRSIQSLEIKNGRSK